MILSILLSGLVLGGCAWWVWRNIKQRIKDYRNYRVGRESEDQVVEKLRTILDNRWTIFRNLQVFAHKKMDEDIILVGPGGVWTLQVKYSRGTVRAQGMEWEVQTKRGWSRATINPSKQVRDQAKQLNFFLQQQGIIRWIEPAVVLASPQPISYFSSSEVPVWLLPDLEEHMPELITKQPPTQEEIQKIVTVLKGVATKQRTKEEEQGIW